MEKARKAPNKRKIVALILLVTFIMLPISGMYIHGLHGKAAGHIWLHLHVIFGVLFVLAGIYHIVCNWRVLKHYLTGKK